MIKIKWCIKTKNIFLGASKKSFLFLPFLSFLLAGCAGLNSKFDCPMKACARCESLDETNARIDRGEIGNNKNSLANAVPINVSPEAASISTESVLSPVRVPDRTMRIWTAPFEDSSHNYHEASVVYTVVRPSAWGTPSVEGGRAQHA